MDKIQAKIFCNPDKYYLCRKSKVMNKKCFHCGSPITKKNGFKNGAQRYKCHACGKQFTGGFHISTSRLWEEYSEGKQTYCQLSQKHHCSVSTIRRKLDQFSIIKRKKKFIDVFLKA